MIELNLLWLRDCTLPTALKWFPGFSFWCSGNWETSLQIHNFHEYGMHAPDLSSLDAVLSDNVNTFIAELSLGTRIANGYLGSG